MFLNPNSNTPVLIEIEDYYKFKYNNVEEVVEPVEDHFFKEYLNLSFMKKFETFDVRMD